MAEYVGGDMIRGHIDTIILNSLIDGDKDTNQIRDEIEERAAGRFQLKQGTFYSALQRISKQGLVNEYRTTGADGVRRKFFQLTEKGKAHIEQNQSSWTMSRQVINNLIDAPQSKEDKKIHQTPTTVEEKLPDFDTEEKVVSPFESLDSNEDSKDKLSDKKFIFDAATDEEEPSDTETAVTDEQIPSVFDLPKSEYDENEEMPSTFEDILDIVARVDEDELLQRERKQRELDAQMYKEQYDSVYNELNAEPETQSESLPTEQIIEQTKIEDIVHENTVFDNVQQPVVTTKADVKDEQNLEQTSAKTITEPIIQTATDTVDDYLNSDDIPTVKDYKEVLSSIFATSKKQEIPKPVIEEPVVTTDNKTQINIETKPIEDHPVNESEEYDVIVDELDFSTKNQPEPQNIDDAIENNRKNLSSKRNQTSASKLSIDYDDILELSRTEGFKVTTSDKTNKNELGKILINRLNFHSFLIFYLMIVLEVLIVGFSMEPFLQFGIEAYIIFCGVLLLLPLITGVLYYMAPKRTVAEVSSFKSSFETALIVTLNIILIVLVYAVIIDLDFSSMQEVTKIVLIPILAIINIPLYVVIRYSLLEKQMYFS